MLVLGIESSCDETAAAVVQNKCRLLSNVIASQIDVHRRYGGVVPEVASRKHVESIGAVVVQALEDAAVTIDELTGIAVTKGPGLIGSLLVGLSVAKAMAFARRIPLVGVNHLESHIASIFLSDRTPDFPFLALVVSGGHTIIYHVHDFGRMTIIGQTRDDAAGEAFDKGAKMLDIGYPGGMIIDRLAREGEPDIYRFPRAMKDTLDFSFSGLKTALLETLKKKGEIPKGRDLSDMVASYQEAIIDVLVSKTCRAADLYSVRRIVVCGGVAANSRLRERFRSAGSSMGLDVFIPEPLFCTDNAAMVAVLGSELLKRNVRDRYNMDALSRWPFSSEAVSP